LMSFRSAREAAVRRPEILDSTHHSFPPEAARRQL
jgi:hypothetical protein